MTKHIKRVVSTIVIAVAVCCLLSGCLFQSMRESAYYADSDNYIQSSGVVSHYQYSDDGSELYISFTEIPEGCEYLNFKISGDALETAKQNEIDKYVGIGSEITFVTAPKMFGDGYCPPIVGLICDGKTIIPNS